MIFKFVSSLLFVLSFLSSLSAEENFQLIDGTTKNIFMEVGPSIDKPISPCSTFKIALSLMGYDKGILKSENSPKWSFQEGYDDWLVSWKEPQTPQSWMNFSCVWFSKLLALELGVEKIQYYLDTFEYGNQDISACGVYCNAMDPCNPMNPVWINSSLKISLRKQVNFIQKMISEQLPISPHAIQMTKAILFKEELDHGWKLYGKTGWSGSEIAKTGTVLEHGWFVGWIEKENQFFPFAYLIREHKIDLGNRIPRVKQLLTESGLIR